MFILFKYSNSIPECSSGKIALLVFVFLIPFLVIALLLINAKFSTEINSGMLAICIDYLQGNFSESKTFADISKVIALFAKFNLDWPQPALQLILDSVSFASFNIDLIGLECFFGR